MRRFQERLYPDVGQFFDVERTLYRGRSRFQRIEVLQTARVGRALVLDGIVQATEADEFVYHEMLTHVPILAHGAVERVLIIGGGDGGILEEVLKHKGVKKAVMVEIDRAVIEHSRRHLGAICGRAFADRRTELVIGDGARYIRETDERFDLIVLDRPDPVGPAEVLFARGFYRACRARLRPRGILTAQNGVPIFQADELKGACRLLKSVFPARGCYVAAVPTYYGGFMALTWASDRDIAKTSGTTLERRFRASRIATRYYNPALHSAAFKLPSYIRDLVGRS